MFPLFLSTKAPYSYNEGSYENDNVTLRPENLQNWRQKRHMSQGLVMFRSCGSKSLDSENSNHAKHTLNADMTESSF